MINITVNASRKYDVLMEHGILSQAGQYISNVSGSTSRKICIVSDTTVSELYGQKTQPLWRSLEASGFKVFEYVFNGDETNKNMSTVVDILEYLAKEEFTRADMILALGGGVIGDIAGFTAATYLRGVEFIQVPTTLLAIVDSSVGGKTGVNLSSGKNLAGAFWQPSLVIFDPEVLATLDSALKLDGLAEIIKAGFIDAPEIFALIDNRRISLDDHDFLTKLAAMAVEVKRKIVEEDERESGNRQLLNLGHTAAHAIEKLSSYSISHGHAVAMGMAIITAAAKSYGWCDDKCLDLMLDTLYAFGLPLKCTYSAAELTSAALHDKKRRGDHITLVIPKAAGSCSLKTIAVDQLEEVFDRGLEVLNK